MENNIVNYKNKNTINLVRFLLGERQNILDVIDPSYPIYIK